MVQTTSIVRRKRLAKPCRYFPDQRAQRIAMLQRIGDGIEARQGELMVAAAYQMGAPLSTTGAV